MDERGLERTFGWPALLAVALLVSACDGGGDGGMDAAAGGDAGPRPDAALDAGAAADAGTTDSGSEESDAGLLEDGGLEAPDVVLDQPLAFPTAMGFGRGATGGEGGRIIRVTNLDDAGEGSLRAAVEASGARVVHFDVAGNIVLRSRLFVNDGDLTIAGETAPGDGIAIVSSGDESSFNGSLLTLVGSNVVVRFIRLRRLGEQLGSNSGGGGILGQSDGLARDYIYDHVSWSWMSDDLTGAAYRGATAITYQNCMFYEAVRKTDAEWHGGKGTLFYADIGDLSLIRNMWASIPQRNPSFSGYTVDARLEHINNFVYNRAFQGLTIRVRQEGEDPTRPVTASVQANVIGNRYVPGEDTFVSSERYSIAASDTPAIGVHVDDNLTQQRTSVDQPEWDCMGTGANGTEPAPTSLQSVTPFEMTLEPEDILPGDEVESHVLANAGASLSRDSADARIAGQVADRTARIIREAFPIDREYPVLQGEPWTYAPGTHIPADFAASHGVTSDDEVREVWVIDGIRVLNSIGASAYQMWRWHRAGDLEALVASE